MIEIKLFKTFSQHVCSVLVQNMILKVLYQEDSYKSFFILYTFKRNIKDHITGILMSQEFAKINKTNPRK